MIFLDLEESSTPHTEFQASPIADMSSVTVLQIDEIQVRDEKTEDDRSDHY